MGIEAAAKEIARRRRLDPTLLELLSKWWRDKYHLPSTHELFLGSTLLELLIEFWEDQFYDTQLEVYRNEKGDIQFVKTGDKVVDRWEKEFADGKIPNYLDAFSQEQIDKLNRMRTQGKDRFGNSVPPSTGTLKDTVNSVSQEALRQGLGDPSKVPFPYKRFTNKDIAE